MRKLLLPVAFILPVSVVHAQDHAPVVVAAPAAAAVVEPAAAAAAASTSPQVSLAANSDIPVTVVAPLKSGKVKVGHTFKIVTASDTLQDGVVIIPKGTEGLGRVTFSKGGGAFGKSGQMELAFTSLSLNGQTIALQGKYREQGSGNGGAAAGAVLAGGVIGGLLVHGRSVEIAVGKVMHAQNVAEVTSGAAEAAPATTS